MSSSRTADGQTLYSAGCTDQMVFETKHDKTNKMTCAPSEDSDQSDRCPPEDGLRP